MGREGEKKTVRQLFLDWWLPFVALVLVVGAGRSFVLWQDRNYGQLTTSLITVLGVVVTLWMTQVRAIEQQEREDKRHHTRLEAEAKMHDERLRVESEREYKRLASEAQKDRAQRSIAQRIDLAEKLASAVEHLSSENELKQAAGVQEILFQIDDWHTLIEAEFAEIEGEGEGAKMKREKLRQESLRHRQELFDIAYKFDTENLHVLRSRARGLKQRLRKESSYSLVQLDFSGMVIGFSRKTEECDSKLDLRGIVADGFIMSNAKMSNIDLSDAHLESANLEWADLKSSILANTHLEMARAGNADLESSILAESNLKLADLFGVNFKSAGLWRANLESTNLSCANLESAILTGANLESANLKCVKLESAYLPDSCLKLASLENAILKSAFLKDSNLESANLMNANLESAILGRANLRLANFQGADLESAILWDAHLEFDDMCDDYFPWGKLKRENLLEGSRYDKKTIFPFGFNPEIYGMILVDEADEDL